MSEREEWLDYLLKERIGVNWIGLLPIFIAAEIIRHPKEALAILIAATGIVYKASKVVNKK